MTAPSLLILGTDTVLAAPASAVQLAHACLAAGYEAVIPATWGDELIAAHAMRRVMNADDPVVLCACPLVAQRLVDHASALEPMLLSTASPPVATALYLRALYSPGVVHITYAGGCPGGSDENIDVHLTHEDLLAELASKRIDASTQPTEFDSILPPDRRRFFSEAGGMLSRSALRDASRDVSLHELGPDDLVMSIAQRLLERSQALIDAGPALGCVCSGALGTRNPLAARAAVRGVEPPRATSPVLDHSISIEIERPLPAFVASERVTHSERALGERPPVIALSDLVNTASGAKMADKLPPAPPPPVAVPAPQVARAEESTVIATFPRRSPPGTGRAVLGIIPQARTEPGRQLPRAYVARRRSTPRSVRALGSRNSGATASNQSRTWLWVAIGVLAVATGIGAISMYAAR